MLRHRKKSECRWLYQCHTWALRPPQALAEPAAHNPAIKLLCSARLKIVDSYVVDKPDHDHHS